MSPSNKAKDFTLVETYGPPVSTARRPILTVEVFESDEPQRLDPPQRITELERKVSLLSDTLRAARDEILALSDLVAELVAENGKQRKEINKIKFNMSRIGGCAIRSRPLGKGDGGVD